MPRDRTVFYLGNEDNDRRLQTRLKQIFPFDVRKKLMLISGLSNEKPLTRGQEELDLFREIKTRYPDCVCIFVDTIQGIHKISEVARGTKPRKPNSVLCANVRTNSVFQLSQCTTIASKPK